MKVVLGKGSNNYVKLMVLRFGKIHKDLNSNGKIHKDLTSTWRFDINDSSGKIHKDLTGIWRFDINDPSKISGGAEI